MTMTVAIPGTSDVQVTFYLLAQYFVKDTKKKTYNSEDSPVVTDLSTNSPLLGLTMGERTGSRIFQELWSYVIEDLSVLIHI